MTQHVTLRLLLFICWLILGLLSSVEHHSMHPEEGSFIFGVREEALALDCRGYDVSDLRALLG